MAANPWCRIDRYLSFGLSVGRRLLQRHCKGIGALHRLIDRSMTYLQFRESPLGWCASKERSCCYPCWCFYLALPQFAGLTACPTIRLQISFSFSWYKHTKSVIIRPALACLLVARQLILETTNAPWLVVLKAGKAWNGRNPSAGFIEGNLGTGGGFKLEFGQEASKGSEGGGVRVFWTQICR